MCISQCVVLVLVNLCLKVEGQMPHDHAHSAASASQTDEITLFQMHLHQTQSKTVELHLKTNSTSFGLNRKHQPLTDYEMPSQNSDSKLHRLYTQIMPSRRMWMGICGALAGISVMVTVVWCNSHDSCKSHKSPYEVGSCNEVDAFSSCSGSNEYLHLLRIFFIGTIHAYGPIMTYPVYRIVVGSRNIDEGPAFLVGTVFFLGRVVAQGMHWLGLVLCGAGLRSVQRLILTFYSIAMVGAFIATFEQSSSMATLFGVCCITLVSSRSISALLFIATDEDVMTVRILLYEFAQRAGSMWAGVVSVLLKHESFYQTSAGRFGGLSLPMIIPLACWLSIPKDMFMEEERLKDAQGDQQPGREPSSSAVEWGKFRIIAITMLLLRWSFSFFAFNAFPIIIRESGGPPLATVTALYGAEGVVYCFTAVPLTWAISGLGNSVLLGFTGGAWLVCLIPPIVVCTLGPNWFGYIIAVFAMDISHSVSNLLLAKVMHRCLRWEWMPLLSSQVNAVGGFVYALAMFQIPLSKHIGWPGTSVVGHGGALMVVALVYWYDRVAFLKMWDDCERFKSSVQVSG